MLAPSEDLRDIIMYLDGRGEERYKKHKDQTIFHVGFDLSAAAVESHATPDGILFLDIQGRGPDITIGQKSLGENYQFPVVQMFYNFKQKKTGDHDYSMSYRAGEYIKSLLHGFNSWKPVNGTLYQSIIENTSTGYLDISQALSFPLLSTNFECQRQPANSYYVIEDFIEENVSSFAPPLFVFGTGDNFDGNVYFDGDEDHSRIDIVIPYRKDIVSNYEYSLEFKGIKTVKDGILGQVPLDNNDNIIHFEKIEELEFDEETGRDMLRYGLYGVLSDLEDYRVLDGYHVATRDDDGYSYKTPFKIILNPPN